MEAAYISAFAVLAGTAIGGLTSFATSRTTQQAQARAQRLAAEAAKLYADALQSRRDDMSSLSTYTR
jgi:HAMP domain-containing protein